MMTYRSEILNLPPVVDITKQEKRYASMPDLSGLKDQQREAFDKMKRFLTETKGGFFLLEGYAGTGKSFVMARLIEWFLATSRQSSVAMSAPTNKAVRVVQNFAEYYHSNLKYGTIHSLLGLKEQIDQWGRQQFVMDRNADCKLNEVDLLVIDETSMLSDELFQYLPEFCSKGLKIIFVGDPCQINPIGKVDSIPFNEFKQKEYGIEKASLTEIVRQKSGNPLIEITMQVRQNMERPTAVPLRESSITDKGGVVFLNSGDSDTLEDILKAYYCSPNFDKSSDFVKVIAWTNKVVDYMNNHIRGYVFSDTSQKIVVGERLLANKPIISGIDKKILFTTNDEFIVRSFTIEQETPTPGITFKYYLAKVECFDYTTPRTLEIKIIHEESEELYKTVLDKLKNIAIGLEAGTFAKKRAWESYYDTMEYFADVKYCYAITAHKSQGSTYDTAIVFEGNIDMNKKVKERNRLKYTAFSRPSRLLIVVNS